MRGLRRRKSDSAPQPAEISPELKGRNGTRGLRRKKSDSAPPPAEISPELKGRNGKRGLRRKKSDSTPPKEILPEEVAAGEETNGGDEESADAGRGKEEEEEEEEEEGGEEEEATPKLNEGFYEIEDVRKKRVRKGQTQYLIKWRGWPETANTWEPYDNLQSCADVIEAFEERSRSHNSSKKRKCGGSHNEVKKKHSIGTQDFPLDLSNEDSSPPASADRGGEEGRSQEPVNGSKKADEVEANGSLDALEDGQKKENRTLKVAASFTEEAGPSCTPKGAAGCISIQLHCGGLEDGSMDDGSCKAEFCQQPLQGAKKRKSGSVKRFKHDSPPCDQEEAHHIVVGRSKKLGNQDVDSAEDDIGYMHKQDDSTNPPFITKILKPVSYHASVTNNVQEVSITFKALRSDGKEVLVDDKDLKVNNPLLLISYYEQHLRYSPHS